VFPSEHDSSLRLLCRAALPQTNKRLITQVATLCRAVKTAATQAQSPPARTPNYCTCNNLRWFPCGIIVSEGTLPAFVAAHSFARHKVATWVNRVFRETSYNGSESVKAVRARLITPLRAFGAANSFARRRGFVRLLSGWSISPITEEAQDAGKFLTLCEDRTDVFHGIDSRKIVQIYPASKKRKS
jgi:hypothetical protein